MPVRIPFLQMGCDWCRMLEKKTFVVLTAGLNSYCWFLHWWLFGYPWWLQGR